ncbi:hypothetical protein TthSNM66_23390 (plasmid) [Thermus thermophilus]|uniref:type II toxin-antitoxin system VapC family toxin n=1 Tax=Thermus thermophilus TaxID=274 RepID=UPI001FCC0AB2|nr:type II toxin-antitoxin system VapC family toxin [Thermus thermophilus]BDG27703.1 hypothetical protein TthSNM66_23390 [Thermus thermophilus]BDG30034.1 hypothetical protein TthSNM76_22440 [Thermus thermophilus]
MRLFLETSGLLKVLLREDLPDLAREAFSQAQAHAASAFALPEAVGVFHAMQRDGRLTRPLYRKALRELYELWEYLEVLTPTLEGHMRAARLCERHPLKGADAVHLEGALFLKGLYPDTALLTFDRTLYRAAKKEGLTVVRVPPWKGGADPRPSLPQADRGARVHPHLHGPHPGGDGHPALPRRAHLGGFHLEAPLGPRQADEGGLPFKLEPHLLVAQGGGPHPGLARGGGLSLVRRSRGPLTPLKGEVKGDEP